MWQQVVVSCIVALAALHAGSKYLPARWRFHIVQILTRRGARASTVAGWFKSKPGCGDGCSNCSSPAPCSNAATEPGPVSRRVITLHVAPPQ